MQSKRIAFTLIEVLVVLAIISVLAALIFPVVARGKRAAHKSTCTSNLRQIGAAVLLYEVDNDDQMPSIGWNGWVNQARITHGPDVLAPYGTTEDLYLCVDRSRDPWAQARASAYLLRFSICYNDLDITHLINWRIKPDAESVIAFDPNHATQLGPGGTGILLALRHAGNVERIPPAALVLHSENFLGIDENAYRLPQWWQFPRETFPPELYPPEVVYADW